jgi:farnesyl-diphosphate farnesyltransferase
MPSSRDLPLQDLLVKTSRTFALAIPLLEEPARTEVGLAYLLFRVADTVEDASSWSRAERAAGLADFAALMNKPDLSRARELAKVWSERNVSDHAGYLELVGLLPELLEATLALPEAARAIVVKHVVRTALGMKDIIESGDAAGHVRLTSIDELKRYCYVVAGIVGELLTDLFINDAPQLQSERAVLVANQIAFGEGLQLVNILKDERDDAEGGRSYLPSGVDKREVLALARADLDCARLYTDALERGGAPAGMVAFTTLPRQLAEAALLHIEDRGAGAKVSRAQVAQMLEDLQRFVASQADKAQAGKR